jgi:competence protein ComEA
MLGTWVHRRRLFCAGLFGLALVSSAAVSLAADGPPGGAVVNVNTATVEQLQALPGIGEVRARAIVEARERRGGFKNIDELVEIRGIGPAGLERLRSHVTVSGKTRIPASDRAR